MKPQEEQAGTRTEDTAPSKADEHFQPQKRIAATGTAAPSLIFPDGCVETNILLVPLIKQEDTDRLAAANTFPAWF